MDNFILEDIIECVKEAIDNNYSEYTTKSDLRNVIESYIEKLLKDQAEEIERDYKEQISDLEYNIDELECEISELKDRLDGVDEY